MPWPPPASSSTTPTPAVMAPEGARRCLTGDGPRTWAGSLCSPPSSPTTSPASPTHSARAEGALRLFAPEIHDALDALSGPIYSQLLVRAMPLVPGLAQRLTPVPASPTWPAGPALPSWPWRAFPASTFAGYDLDDAALDRARGCGRRARPDQPHVRAGRRRRAARRRAVRRRHRVQRHPRPGEARRRAARIHDILGPEEPSSWTSRRVSSRSRTTSMTRWLRSPTP